MSRLVLIAACAACGKSDAPEAVAVAPTSPGASVTSVTPVTVDPARTDLVFRYLDPATGEVATAAALADIPAQARGQVVVYDPTVHLPAGWDLVADLAAGTTATPREHFAFATSAARTPSRASIPSASALLTPAEPPSGTSAGTRPRTTCATGIAASSGCSARTARPGPSGRARRGRSRSPHAPRWRDDRSGVHRARPR